jgi:hypothetical protein
MMAIAPAASAAIAVLRMVVFPFRKGRQDIGGLAETAGSECDGLESRGFVLLINMARGYTTNDRPTADGFVRWITPECSTR